MFCNLKDQCVLDEVTSSGENADCTQLLILHLSTSLEPLFGLSLLEAVLMRDEDRVMRY